MIAGTVGMGAEHGHDRERRGAGRSGTRAIAGGVAGHICFVDGCGWCSCRVLSFVPAFEEGASKGAAEEVEHQPGRRCFFVNLDRFGVEGEDREDVAVPPWPGGGPAPQ